MKNVYIDSLEIQRTHFVESFDLLNTVYKSELPTVQFKFNSNFRDIKVNDVIVVKSENNRALAGQLVAVLAVTELLETNGMIVGIDHSKQFIAIATITARGVIPIKVATPLN